MKSITYALLFVLALAGCKSCLAEEFPDLTTGPAQFQSLFIDMDNADLAKGGCFLEDALADSDDAGLAKCYFWCHRAPAVYYYRPRYYYYCWYSPVYRTSFRIVMYSVPVRRQYVAAAPAVPVVTPPVQTVTPPVQTVTPPVQTVTQAVPVATPAVQTAKPAAVPSNSILTNEASRPTPIAGPALSQPAVQSPTSGAQVVQDVQQESAPEVVNTGSDEAEKPEAVAASESEGSAPEVVNTGSDEAEKPEAVAASDSEGSAPEDVNTGSDEAEKPEAVAASESASELVSRPDQGSTPDMDETVANRLAENSRVQTAMQNSPSYSTARHSGIAKSSGRAARGAVIDKPIPADSPLAKLGLRTGDILTHIDGRPVNSIYDLRQAKASSKVTFVRGNEILVSKNPMLQTATNEVVKSFDGSNEETLNMRMIKGMQRKSLNLYEYYDIQAKMEARAAEN